MKLIGYSVSRCVKDIVGGIYNLDDVLLIIGRTRFDQSQIDMLITGYVNQGVWKESDRLNITNILEVLLNTGRLYQPRVHGLYPTPAPFGKHWANAVQAPADMTPATKEAWNNFVISASLDGSYLPKTNDSDPIRYMPAMARHKEE